jgi:hypothetical protein
VEEQGVDPFEVDIESSLATLRKLLPEWELLEELMADADALKSLASIVRLQSEWLAHKASSIFIDPLLIELKIRLASPEFLAASLIRSMHPIASISQFSPALLKRAMDYWNFLPTLAERFSDTSFERSVTPSHIDLDDLIKMRVLTDEEFDSKLRLMQDALPQNGEVNYWDFIKGVTYEQTVEKAYLTSFIVTQGLAELRIDPIQETVSLRAKTTPQRGSRSIALPIRPIEHD